MRARVLNFDLKGKRRRGYFSHSFALDLGRTPVVAKKTSDNASSLQVRAPGHIGAVVARGRGASKTAPLWDGYNFTSPTK